MGRDFVIGVAALIIGGLLLTSVITGTTGSVLAVFLAPQSLQIRHAVNGTYRTIAGSEATGLTTTGSQTYTY